MAAHIRRQRSAAVDSDAPAETKDTGLFGGKNTNDALLPRRRHPGVGWDTLSIGCGCVQALLNTSEEDNLLEIRVNTLVEGFPNRHGLARRLWFCAGSRGGALCAGGYLQVRDGIVWRAEWRDNLDGWTCFDVSASEPRAKRILADGGFPSRSLETREHERTT